MSAAAAAQGRFSLHDAIAFGQPVGEVDESQVCASTHVFRLGPFLGAIVRALALSANLMRISVLWVSQSPLKQIEDYTSGTSRSEF